MKGPHLALIGHAKYLGGHNLALIAQLRIRPMDMTYQRYAAEQRETRTEKKHTQLLLAAFSSTVQIH